MFQFCFSFISVITTALHSTILIQETSSARVKAHSDSARYRACPQRLCPHDTARHRTDPHNRRTYTDTCTECTPWAPTRMGKGAHASPGNVKCFSALVSYSKMFSRRIIYALFLQSVVRFWGAWPHPPNGAPFLYPAGRLSSPDS